MGRRRRRLQLELLEDRSLLAPLTWALGIDLPAPRAGAAAIEAGGAIIIAGGGTTTVNLLGPSYTAWGAAAPIDMARTFSGLAYNGSSYLVYGGQNGNAVLNDALTYDPYNIDNVQDAAVMNPPRTQFGYAANDLNQPIAIGGLDDQNNPLSSVAIYDGVTNTWQSAANLPQSLYSAAAANDGNGHIFVFGGVGASGTVTANVYRYTMDTDTWDVVKPMPVRERDAAAALASNGRIYVLGGTDGGTTLATVQSYDPASDVWSIETSLPAPVSAAAAVGDAAGHLVVIGGYDQDHNAVAKVSVSQLLNAPDSVPIFTSVPATTVLVGSAYSYQATTNANPQSIYTLVAAPANMLIDSNRGLITWTPTLAQAGLNNVTVRATNFAGSTDQTFSVRALTPAPTVPTGVTVSNTTTNSISLSWTPSSDSVGVTGYRVYRVTRTGFHATITVYSKVADVTGTTATMSGLLSGYPYQYAVSAYNASGNESARSAHVSATTLSPVVYTGPSSVNAVAIHPVSFTLSASANPAVFGYTALDPASGMTLNPTTGLVTWTPTDADVGQNYFTYRIDHTLGSVTVVVAITVGSNLPYASYLAGPPAVVNQLFSGQFTQVADQYNTLPVTFKLVSGPVGAAVDASTGLLSWTPGVADIGTTNATVQITNYAGSSSYTVAIPVYFASEARNVAISHITKTSATVTWSEPSFVASPISGYVVTASYRVQSGRFQTTRTLTFTTSSTSTSQVVTGLPAAKSISVSVSPFDSTNRYGVSARTSFTTSSYDPTISISAGPFTYDGSPHAATATALGIGGTPVAGSFSFTYNGSNAPPTVPGNYTVVAIFASSNPVYSEVTASGTMVIGPATPTLQIVGGPFNYDGVAHPATANAIGVDGTSPVLGTFAFTYDGASTPPVAPGVYDILAKFNSLDALYTDSTIHGTLVIKSVGTQNPTLTLVGVPFTFDGAVHGVTATARDSAGTLLNGKFSFTYNGSTTVPKDAATYAVVAYFHSGNPDFRDDSITGSMTIAKATATVNIGWLTYPGNDPSPSIIYDGTSHEALAVAYSIDGLALSGTFDFNYSPTAAPTDAGLYSVQANFTSSDPNYANAIFSTTLTISTYLPYVEVAVDAPAVALYYGEYMTAYSGASLLASAKAFGVNGSALSGSYTYGYFAYDSNTNAFTALSTRPVNAGYYLIQADFVSSDPNYSNSSGSTYLRVVPATPTIVVSGTFAYDGTPHSALGLALGVDSVTAVAGTFSFTYNGFQSPPTSAGTYAVDAYFASNDPNYSDGSQSGSITINKITPSFSNLSSPTAIFGAATTTLAGRLGAGSTFPNGNIVAITVSGVTRTAQVNATGNFTLAFPTSTLAIGTYPITYSFAGDSIGFNPASNGQGTLSIVAALVAPRVTSNPISQTVVAGNAVTFAATATGSPAPSVQWQVSTNGGTSYSNVAGATNSVFTISAVATDNSNRYRAVFTNSVGTATTTAATLTVQAAPVVTTNPSNQTITSGSRVTFTAAATGNPTPTVQWQMSTNGGTTFTNISGATSNSYSVTTTASLNGTIYQAVYTNSIGTATTTKATLTVLSAPVVTTNPTSQTVVAGNVVTFSVAATGNPSPTVQWQVSTNAGTSFVNIAGATNTTLNITSAASLNANRYRAILTNSVGTATTTAAILTVQYAPIVTLNPTSQTVAAGQRVTFTAAATANPAPTVQWQVSTNGGVTYANIGGATSTTLSFTTSISQRGYRYRAVFTNSLGNVLTTEATLTV